MGKGHPRSLKGNWLRQSCSGGCPGEDPRGGHITEGIQHFDGSSSAAPAPLGGQVLAEGCPSLWAQTLGQMCNRRLEQGGSFRQRAGPWAWQRGSGCVRSRVSVPCGHAHATGWVASNNRPLSSHSSGARSPKSSCGFRSGPFQPLPGAGAPG